MWVLGEDWLGASDQPEGCPNLPEANLVIPLIGSNPPAETGQIKKPSHVRAFLLNMARLGGFEPPTARFVAEYSIQLSYKRLSFLNFATIRAHSEGGVL